ncbi:MAG: NOB1 family endonuclease [Candidatus Thermoplasmatota archaeon]|nr:NOB1 family endonuclease [Candidatus Thermoplasmatota archaeon]
MNYEKPTSEVLVVDTSAILSGKQFDDYDVLIITAALIAEELKEGGRDFRRFEYLQAKGLEVHSPTKESLILIKKTATAYGELKRLSVADIHLLALAVDVMRLWEKSVCILSDDYSIQNIASILDIPFLSLSQKGITKKFKWVSRCQGCHTILSESVDACPFCGSPVSHKVQTKESMKKKKR